MDYVDLLINHGVWVMLLFWTIYFSIHVIQTMQMDRQWMYKADRRTKEFIDGFVLFFEYRRGKQVEWFHVLSMLTLPE